MPVNKASELLGMTPGDKTKRELFDRYLTNRALKRIAGQAAAGVSLDIIAMARMEMDGGNCPRCGKAWDRVEYNNMFGEGFYYEPDAGCRCFITCPRCEMYLAEEEMAGSLDNGCPNCGWVLFHKVTKTMDSGEVRTDTLKRYGTGWSGRDNIMRK